MTTPKVPPSNQPDSQWPNIERRSGQERRVVDRGPPLGKKERRVQMEPRAPEVDELDMSMSDWQRLMDESTPPKVEHNPEAAAAARAAAARDRHRN